jgi:hypothetical protein
MNSSIQRFINRLYLNNNQQFVLKNVRVLSPSFEYLKMSKDKPILELYHKVRGNNINDIFDSIEKYGFRINRYGNKGPGIYMANHGRYSYSYDDNIYNVIISNVAYDKEFIYRYRSEKYIPNKSYEYKILNPELIYPKYMITYNINGQYDNMGYVKYGNYGCRTCDHIKKRCDCALDSYDEIDIID